MQGGDGDKGEKNWDNCNSIIIKIYLIKKENVPDFQSRWRHRQHALLPCTTIMVTTNLKTKSTQNCQKIELYVHLTIKDLKKTSPSRRVGGVDLGARAERTQCSNPN